MGNSEDQWLSPEEVERLEDAYKKGMREVVEWVNKNIAFANIGLSYKEWQQQLKKWGLPCVSRGIN